MSEQERIKITYRYTDKVETAKKWLEEAPELIACDFEAGSKLTKERAEYLIKRLEMDNISVAYRNKLQQQLKATGLSHPSLVNITHLSVAWSRDEATVIVITSKEMRDFIYEWLVTTDRKQVWHNAGFDFKHILYNTGKLPKNYEDSQLLAKTILNDANNFKARVGLKELMGYAYDERWKEMADDFKDIDPYDPEFIEYAGIDGCATFKLWHDIHEHPRMQEEGWDL